MDWRRWREKRTEGLGRDLAEAFDRVLTETGLLSGIALSCRWNVEGPMADAARRLFHGQACELFRAQDDLALHLRMFGRAALPAGGLAALRGLPEPHRASRTPAALVRTMAEGHLAALLSIEAAGDVAEAAEDRGALTILGFRVLAHQRHLLALETFAA